jgi:hypothetical protein
MESDVKDLAEEMTKLLNIGRSCGTTAPIAVCRPVAG